MPTIKCSRLVKQCNIAWRTANAHSFCLVFCVFVLFCQMWEHATDIDYLMQTHMVTKKWLGWKYFIVTPSISNNHTTQDSGNASIQRFRLLFSHEKLYPRRYVSEVIVKQLLRYCVNRWAARCLHAARQNWTYIPSIFRRLALRHISLRDRYADLILRRFCGNVMVPGGPPK